MARANTVVTSMTAGELTPLLHGRIDLAWYVNGCRILENMVPTAKGPAESRPGTRHVAPARSDDTAPRLLGFRFSVLQAYILEAGDRVMRFYRDKGQIQEGGAAYELETPWAADELAALRTTQSNDVLWVFHPDHPPRKISRTGHASWTIEEVDADGPYLDANTRKSTTLTPSGTSGEVTITASNHLPFFPENVGQLVTMKHGETWGYARITAYVSRGEVTAQVQRDFGGTDAVYDWRLGLWSGRSGYPASGAFHQQRLVMGGVRAYPNRLDFSVVGDFDAFRDGVEDDEAIAVTLGASEVTAIRWIASAPGALLLGTAGPVFSIDAGEAGAAITATNLRARVEAAEASADVAPVSVDRSVMFVQRAGRRLRSLSYSFEANGFAAADVSLRADHLTDAGIREMGWQAEPHDTLWACRDDGGLISMTYDAPQNVLGWARHPLYGDAQVESVAVIPGPDQDEVWLAVRRTVGGAVRRSIEVMEPFFGQSTRAEDCWHVDAGLELDNRSSPDAALAFGRISPGEDISVAASADVFTTGDTGKVITRGAGRAGDGRAVITHVFGPKEIRVRITVAFPPGELAASQWELRDEISTITGLDHLEGERVAVWADGGAHPDVVVSGGSVTLDNPASRVIAGLGYTRRISPMPLEAGTHIGPAQGQIKQVLESVVSLWRSAGFKMGRRMDRLETVSMLDTQDRLDLAPDLLTGTRRVPFAGEAARAAPILLVQDQPAPFTVVSQVHKVLVGEG